MHSERGSESAGSAAGFPEVFAPGERIEWGRGAAVGEDSFLTSKSFASTGEICQEGPATKVSSSFFTFTRLRRYGSTEDSRVVAVGSWRADASGEKPHNVLAWRKSMGST